MIIREPQNIFFDRNIRGKKSEDEIKEQFEEEQKVLQICFLGKIDTTVYQMKKR